MQNIMMIEDTWFMGEYVFTEMHLNGIIFFAPLHKKLVLTPASRGTKGVIKKANELAEQMGGFVPSQFTNPYNPQAHYDTTGLEIWEDTEGKADIFFAGVGTGGTITGIGRYLKEKNPAIKIVATEPAGSPVLSDGIPGLHKIQGIGAGFIPDILGRHIVARNYLALQAGSVQQVLPKSDYTFSARKRIIELSTNRYLKDGYGNETG